VVLDTNLSEELIEEGFVREIISKLQTMRKEAGFEVMDRICVYQDGNDKIKEIIKRNICEIKTAVLADDVLFGNIEGTGREWNLNGEIAELGVKKCI